MMDQIYRKEKKIFKQMSEFVRTRVPDQCRSHHQKMLKFHFSIENLLKSHFRKEQIYEQTRLDLK